MPRKTDRRVRDCESGCDREIEKRQRGKFNFLAWHMAFAICHDLGRKLPLVCFPDGNFLPESLLGSSWAIEKGGKNLVAFFPLLCSSLVLLPRLL